MRKYLLALAVLAGLISPARAVDTTVSAMTAAGALDGTELLYCVQAGADRKCTPAQINTYVLSLMGAGVGTFLGTPSSANLRAALTDETGTGLAYFQGGALGTPASGTLTNATGLPVATGISGLGTGIATALGVNVGTAGAPVINGGALGTPASGTLTNATGLPIATGVSGLGTGVAGAAAAALNSATGLVGALTPTNSNCVVGNGTAWTSAACPGGGGGVSSIAGNTGAFTLNATSGITNSTNDIICSQGSSSQFGCVKADGTSITAAAGVLSAVVSVTPSVQSGANYAFGSGDRGKVVFLDNAANQTPTIPQAVGNFGSGWFVQACNINAGVQTITPTTSTIGGAASYALPAGSAAAPKCVAIISDGTNYRLYVDGAALNGTNTWTGTNTFGSVVGSVSTQSGTTYTFASSDCGTTVRFTNAAAVTATIPQGLPIGCNIAVLQAGAGQVAVNGSAVTPATLQSAHSYTKTFGAGAVIGLLNDTTNHVILTGDGAT